MPVPTSSTRLPPLRAIQAFEAVARTGSVTLAAAELHVSPGAISQQLRKIEALLELPLFERRGKGLALSSWGALYHQELGAVFAQLHRAHAMLAHARQNQELVVSSLSSVAAKWLGLVLLDWQEKYPQARLILRGTEVEPDLDGGEADFRITYGTQAERHARRTALHTDWLVPACVPARLQGGAGLSPAQVLQGPLIHVEWEKVYQSPPGWVEWAHALGLAVTPRTHSLRFSLSGNAIDAALAGRGIVLAPASMLDADLRSGRLVVPYNHRLRLPESYFLAWSRTALDKPFAGELMHWLRAAALAQAAHEQPLQARAR